jgi:WD40 repeat protein
VLPEHQARVVEFSPDSRVMLTDGDSGAVVRDAATGRVLAGLMMARPNANGPTRATGITWPKFTADGRHVIVQLGGPRFGSELTVTLAVFDVATGRECASFPKVGWGIWWGSSIAPAEYALSADGSTLAFSQGTGIRPAERNGQSTFQRLGNVTVWDIAKEKVIAEFPGIPPLALAPDGSALAYDDTDSPASFPTIRMLKPVRPATSRVRSIAGYTGQSAGPIGFSPDGKLLAAKVVNLSQTARFSRQSEAVELRDASSGQVRAVWDPRGNNGFSAGHIGFSPDARTLMLKDLGGYSNSIPERIQSWDLSGASPNLGVQAPSEAFTPDGSRAAIAEFNMASRWTPVYQYSVVEVFDQPATKARIHLVEPGVVHNATISPNGWIMALPSLRVTRDGSNWDDSFLSLIHRALGESRSTFADFTLPTINFYEIKLRDAATGRLLSTIDRSARRHLPQSMTFSPDSKTLVVKYLPADFKGWSSQNEMIDWSVELWDIPTDWPRGGIYELAPALSAASLVLAGVWIDRRRGRRPSVLATD